MTSSGQLESLASIRPKWIWPAAALCPGQRSDPAVTCWTRSTNDANEPEILVVPANSSGSKPANGAIRPVLKWAGGKRRLVPVILERLPESIDTYYEPFVGSGAVFFALAARRRFRRAILSDRNQELINVYKALKKDHRAVISLLREYRTRHTHDVYYEVRAQTPKDLDLFESAARTIYLNKTGFNGLYRVNRAGQFNVPLGRYSNPNICDEPRLELAATVLKRVRLEVKDFEAACQESGQGDAVYFDPPYVPLSKTSNFTAYHHEAFADEQQQRLAEVFTQLAQRAVRVVLSNSDTPRTRELYAGWRIDPIKVARPINSKGSKRGLVNELIVSNDPH